MENRLTDKQAKLFWKEAYSFMDNVKIYMDNIYDLENGNITDKHVRDLDDFKTKGWSNIIKYVTSFSEETNETKQDVNDLLERINKLEQIVKTLSYITSKEQYEKDDTLKELDANGIEKLLNKVPEKELSIEEIQMLLNARHEQEELAKINNELRQQEDKKKKLERERIEVAKKMKIKENPSMFVIMELLKNGKLDKCYDIKDDGIRELNKTKLHDVISEAIEKVNAQIDE
jgi:hypothetical protein